MHTSSAKAKGRRLQDKIVLKLRNLFKDILVDGDIKPQPMGQAGADVILSPSAKNIIAFDVEAKNQEALIGAKLTDAIEQCESNTEEGRIPLLVFKKNQEPERVILKLSDFMELIYPSGDVTFGMDDAQKVIVELEKIKQQIQKGRQCKSKKLSSSTPKQPA